MHNRSGVDASSTTGDVYRIDRSGQIFQYIGWKRLDCKSNTVAISAGDSLYRLDSAGYIFKHLPDDSTWLQIDHSGKVKYIATGGPYVYKLHRDGSVWKSDGSTEWNRIDNNPDNVSIAADGNDIYLLHKNGAIFKLDQLMAWNRIDNNKDTNLIVAGWGNIYLMHRDGEVWRFNGSCWDMLDAYHGTVQITAGAAGLFQHHSDTQEVYAHVKGREWVSILTLGNGEVISDISSGNDGLYVAKKNGEVLRYDTYSGKWFNIQ